MDKYDSLTPTVAQLEHVDGWDLCERVAALQLVPANARFRVRLEAAAHAAAALPLGQVTHRLSEGRFKTLLTDSALSRTFAWMEDPIENYFCEPFLFYGGEYLVPSDQSPVQSFALDVMANALARRPEGIPANIVDECLGILSAAAVIGDRACRGAGLSRYATEEALDRRVPVFPPGVARERLIESLTFSSDEILEVAAQRGAPEPRLAPLVSTAGTSDLAVFDSDGGPLYTRPILKNDESYLLALPAALCTAAYHQVVSKCIAGSVREQLVQALTDEVWSRMRHASWLLGLPEGTEHAALYNVRSEHIDFDRDKSLVVRLFVDPLEEHDPDELTGRLPEAAQQFDALLADVAAAREGGRASAGILLVFTATNGYFIPVLDSPDTRMCEVMPADLYLRFAELEIRHWSRLWYYLRDKDDLTEGARTLATDERDVLAIYRDNEYSFYLSDEARPTFVHFTVGSGLTLLKDAARRFDAHVKAIPERGYGWVTRRWEGSTLPVYVSKAPTPGLALVEMPQSDLWVAVNSESARLSQQILDVIVYWFARLSTDCPSFRLQSSEHAMVLDTSDLEALLGAGTLVREDAAPAVLHHNSRLTRLIITSGVTALPGVSDTTGELGLVALCVDALMPDSEEVIRHLRLLAGERCRMMQPVDLGEELAADPSGLSRPVFAEPAQVSAVLDQAGKILQRRVGERAISKGHLLNEMVGVLYEEITRRLAEYEVRARLMWLVEHNESLASESELNRLTFGTRRRCFDGFGDYEQDLLKERTERDSASVACRFLIELSGSLPSGPRDTGSRTDYDALLALATQLVGFGIESDLIHYGLADFEVSMLPSGRLGRGGSQYSEAIEQYVRGFIERQPDALRDSILFDVPEYLRVQQQKAVSEVQDAMTAELGLTAESIGAAFSVLYEIASDEEKGVVSRPLEEVRQALCDSAGAADTDVVLDLLVLPTRHDFLKPDAPFTVADVYPWRFNRSLSYARRPLTLAESSSGSSLIWGKRQLARSIRLLAQDLESARYKARSEGMRRAQGMVNDSAGRLFNWRVATAIRAWFPGSRVLERFSKVGRVAMPGELGDIDVLWTLPAHRLLLAVECKHLRPARTPAELSTEMRSLVVGNGDAPSHVERHHRRVEWVAENLDALLVELGVTTKGKWTSAGLIITDVRPMSSFVATVPMPVLSLAGLARLTEQALLETVRSTGRRTRPRS